GASHLELIRCSKTNRVRLIELNARLAGDFPRAQNFFRFNMNGEDDGSFLRTHG
ncbi:unnamed protein product, partial [Amoebophrya sp. A25]